MAKKNEVKTVVEVKTVDETKKVETAKVDEKPVTAQQYDELLANHIGTCNTLVAEYNNLDDDATPKATFLDLQEKIDKAVKAYNDVSFAKLLFRLKGSDDAMKLALTEYSYPTIKAQLKEDGDDVAKVEQMVIIPVSKPIDLKKVNSKLGKFGANPKWINLVEKFNMLLTIRMTQEVGSSTSAKVVNDTFDICDDSKAIELQPDLVSQNKMIKALQMVIDAMLGEGSFKVNSHDTKFIEWRYGKKGKEKLTIKASNLSDFMTTILNVGHKLVTGGEYKVDYKIKKS